MACVEPDGVAEGVQGLVEVLDGEVLVAAQRVGVREVGVQLQRALEETHSRLMLALQTEAVAQHAPAHKGGGQPSSAERLKHQTKTQLCSNSLSCCNIRLQF